MSRRLEAILKHIDTPVLADIGCDHAYLCCEAALRNKVQKAYACDVAEGPLEHAKKTISEYELKDKVYPVLSDGFKNVPEDVTLAVIAGMGSETIQEILQDSEYKGQLLLSPHKDVSALRKWLQTHSFRIQWEEWIQDGHFYPVILTEPGYMELSPEEEEFGKNVLISSDYRNYLETMMEKYSNLEKKIPLEKQQVLQQKKALLQQRIQKISRNFERTE